MTAHLADGVFKAPSINSRKQRTGFFWRRFFCYYWPMKKLSDQGLFGQLATVCGIVAAFGIPLGAGLLWAADVKINEKYATDSDLKSVQEVIRSQVINIQASVDQNTKSVNRIGESVDGLTLVVMDLRRDRLAEEIRIIKMTKSRRADQWTDMEARNLRMKEQALSDLNTQRKALFNRVIQDN